MIPRVFVDAKVFGVEQPNLPRQTFVGFVVEGHPELDRGAEVSAYESDDAELHAVYFAIQRLKDELNEFCIVCDNESVVSIIERKDEAAARKRPILTQILKELDANPTIKVQLHEKNPAHKFLNSWLASLRMRSEENKTAQ